MNQLRLYCSSQSAENYTQSDSSSRHRTLNGAGMPSVDAHVLVFDTLTVGTDMAKMGWFLGGFLLLTIGIGILATIPPG